MRILDTVDVTPLSRVLTIWGIPRTSIDYLVIFTESCKFVRVGTLMLDVVCKSPNDVVADIVGVDGESMLTPDCKIYAWKTIMQYIGDASDDFKQSYADGVVLSLHDVDAGVDF